MGTNLKHKHDSTTRALFIMPLRLPVMIGASLYLKSESLSGMLLGFDREQTDDSLLIVLKQVSSYWRYA